MSIITEVYTIGSGDLLVDVFNSVAVVFTTAGGIVTITNLAIWLGGLSAIFEFAKSKEVKVLAQWVGLYLIVTSLMLYPKATVEIVDTSGTDLTLRAVDNVPLSLAVFANITSKIGIGLAQKIEDVFHMPDDETYNKTGMLMGSKLILASQNFEITDSEFSETLNAFMQQCVFYDLLLQKYTLSALIHSTDPWGFIKANTSVARAFPLNGTITICKTGAAQLDEQWGKEIANASSIYGTKQGITGNLLTRLSDGYGFLTKVSEDGAALMKKNLLANAMSQAVAHYGANSNSSAALIAFEDSKTELQIRHTLDETGRQAGYWLQQFQNVTIAVLYGAFIFIYFLSYFPFGASIVRNYLLGMVYLQSLSPVYAIVNYAATFYASHKSTLFMGTDGGLSMANIGGISQANADAMALAGYLSLGLTLVLIPAIFKGLPSALQSAGHLLGGVLQNSASHVTAEAIGGNISVGNTNFGNHSQNNTNANHFDTNTRMASGALTMQTSTGSTITVTPDGHEVMDSRGAISSLGASIHMSDSIRTAASMQAHTSYTATQNQLHASSEQYGAAFRQLSDVSHQKSSFLNSGDSSSMTNTSGFAHSGHKTAQLVDSLAKDLGITREESAALAGQVYASAKAGINVGVLGAGVGTSTTLSHNQSQAKRELYDKATRWASDHNFVETVDSAKRAAQEEHFRTSNDEGSRFAQSFSSSFDKGDSYRHEATSSYQKAQSYSTLASQTKENAALIDSNRGQEFYEWMRTQPSNHGRDTLSKSMINSMSPEDLQHYADRYVNAKTAEVVHEFDNSHGLSGGRGNVLHDFHHNNQSISGESAIHQSNQVFDKSIAEQTKKEGIQGVQQTAKQQVKQEMEQNDSSLNSRKQEIEKAHQQIE